MNWKTLTPFSLACLLAVTTLGAIAGEGDYAISRSTMSSGGSNTSAGGDYELSSTIGQPQGGAIAGGAYSVDGGFWHGVSPGDCGADGYVDLLDHVAFFDCVTGPDVSNAANECHCYDVNRNGTIDLLDFADILTSFTGS